MSCLLPPAIPNRYISHLLRALHRLGQGRDKLLLYLTEHPDVCDELEEVSTLPPFIRTRPQSALLTNVEHTE